MFRRILKFFKLDMESRIERFLRNDGKISNVLLNRVIEKAIADRFAESLARWEKQVHDEPENMPSWKTRERRHTWPWEDRTKHGSKWCQTNDTTLPTPDES